jgi:tetratricopeptide (TPR) repeat protein
VDLSRRSLVLDPLNAAIARENARTLIYARRYADAAASAREAMSMSDNKAGAQLLAEPLIRLGRYDDARKVIPDIDADWNRFTLTAILEARAGNRVASDAALAALRGIDDGTLHYQFAQIHAERGETAAALDEIEAALRTKDPGLADIAVDPAFDSIRREPRFKAVQENIIPPDLFVPPKRG